MSDTAVPPDGQVGDLSVADADELNALVADDDAADEDSPVSFSRLIKTRQVLES